jgi:hypothetical protein
VNGNILDLYIAMRDDAFSWAELNRSPTIIGGLEACWKYDTILDGSSCLDESQTMKDPSDDSPNTDGKPSAGDLIRTWSPPATRLKRNASAISRSPSFGSADGESKMTKSARQRVSVSAPAVVESLSRRAEAV